MSREKVENIKLFGKIREVILDARKYVSRRINYAQIVSNWLIGQMIVEDEQKGKHSAEYGKLVIEYLSKELLSEFGSGYSDTNLQYFRRFYLLYRIPYAVSGELQKGKVEIPHAVRTELEQNYMKNRHAMSDEFKSNSLINIIEDTSHPLTAIVSLNLSWTHYRILLKVDNDAARNFYMKEASENNWSTRALGRQVNSLYYERLISSQNKEIVKEEAKEKTQSLRPENLIKDPMVLEFLQIKKNTSFLESELEEALLDHLNEFLLELGKGFAFVARQKHISTQTKDYYVDLVFYNYLLKCFVLIDLKTRELTHSDIGQMDMYVRYYEDKIKTTDDKPTIGIIMSAEKDETIVKYSVLNESKQLFATKYKLYIPSEEELKQEIENSKLIYKLNK
ncbi:MAG: PDDEXK nuclease domain-containing protein [Bacteroidales bacterium]|nr:PDDEXK nuclease domain-containing protein [Bacteroidales bacterium]